MLDVSILGGGYFAGFHADGWQRITGARLIAAADLEPDRVGSWGVNAYGDLTSMLAAARPDILDIVTPPETHAMAITQAIAAGVPTVICQKPFCTSLNEARRVVRQARDAQTRLIVHENFRFQPWYRAIHQAIDDGLIGPVAQVSFRMRTGDGQGADAYMARQPYFQKMKRFLVHETAVHWIDTFRYLIGEPDAVYADLRRCNPAIAGEDAGYILFDYPNGARAIFDGNRLLDHATSNPRLTFGEALVEGPRGSITLSGDGSVRLRMFQEQDERLLLAAQNYAGFAGDCVHALQSHVIEALNGEAEFENLAADYLSVIETEEAVYKSAREGRKVDLPVV